MSRMLSRPGGSSSVDERDARGRHVLDVNFYGQAYPDLDPLTSASRKRHWRRVGRRENRIPNQQVAQGMADELAGGRFDPFVYLALNPDLPLGGIRSEVEALLHYIYVGHQEHRRHQAAAASGTSAIDQPIADVPAREWPTTKLEPMRVDASAEPLALVESILGRRLLEHERAANLSWASSTEPAVVMEQLLNGPEMNDAELALRKMPTAQFVKLLALIETGHLPSPSDFDELVTYMDCVPVRRDRMLLHRVPGAVQRAQEALLYSTDNEVSEEAAEGHRFFVMGTGRTMGWDEVPIEEPEETVAERFTERSLAGLPLGIHPPQRVAVLSSIHRPGSYLEGFLSQMENQTHWRNIELACLAVDCSEQEVDLLSKFASVHSNVILKVIPDRIGIYEAWNIGLDMTSAPLVTNANVDDVRHRRSIEIQQAVLGSYDWIDVVYQDVLYTPDPSLPWDEIEDLNVASRLPHVTAWSLRGLNSPHNAPMWRRSLHDEFGKFDEGFQSASDYEFWLRCASARKQFFKVRFPHVAYFPNPTGVSTRRGGRGQIEAWQIEQRHGDALAYPEPPPYLPDALTESAYLPRADRASLGLIRLLQQIVHVEEQEGRP